MVKKNTIYLIPGFYMDSFNNHVRPISCVQKLLITLHRFE
uniref:Uncharacterized protein n=1 Tax=Anguilla anguilla TaxID=7936 RepID=A0A0E9T6N2_ANGAN